MSDEPWGFIPWAPPGPAPSQPIAPRPAEVAPANQDRCWLCLGKGDQGEGSLAGSCPCCHGTGKARGKP